MYKDFYVTVKSGSSFSFPSMGKQQNDLNQSEPNQIQFPPREAFGKKSIATNEALKSAFIVKDYYILCHSSYQLARIPRSLFLQNSNAL